ncbi:putative Baseplate assembly protein W [uncultured Alphaproteobacteria bacterium]|uniref:Putative Baseplate assembly protein W n=1 Tax=uncultured Alphaproteobacteria bacterium TaxID=91750 RepID=A0A212J4Q2_9PROT|nr:putative Baseplate assembly protein W [uncultured Alphaproteobacteria bacterium]
MRPALTTGIDPVSGTVVDELAHIRLSISEILKTPVGSRVMRRAFGSHVFSLIDAPGNPITALRLIAAAADALERWEPRVRLASGRVEVTLDGSATIRLVCKVKASGLTITADVPMAGAA